MNLSGSSFLLKHQVFALRLAFLCTLVAGSNGCRDSLRVVDGPRGDLLATPSTIDLGQAFTSQRIEGVFVLRSVGERPVRYTARFGAPAAGFTIVGSEGFLGTTDETELVVSYRSNRVGRARTTIEFYADNSSTPSTQLNVVAEATLAPDCEDGNGCTTDRFDPQLGICVHVAEPLPCDDFNECTMQDACVEGICLGRGTNCDDQNVCTEDLCDPRQGCVHRLSASCNDGDPCTIDTCDPITGCQHALADQGTPCGFEQCMPAICDRFGLCQPIPEDQVNGTPCRDNNPCNDPTNPENPELPDQCLNSVCGTPLGLGDLQFETNDLQLAPGTEENPLVSFDDTIFVGVVDGVTALDSCGQVVWTSTVGEPQFSAAVALPGSLSIPVGSSIIDLDQTSGSTLAEIEIEGRLPPTRLTEPTTTRIVDMAARASGALVISVERRAQGTSDTEGYLVELDAPHEVVSVLGQFGRQTASRIAIDADESVVISLGDGPVNRDQVSPRQLIRLGIGGVVNGSWSTSPVRAAQNDIAIGAASEVLWTVGLIRVERAGNIQTIVPPPALELDRARGSPILFGPLVLSLEKSTGSLVGFTSTGDQLLQVPIPDIAPETTPVVDQMGNVFVLSQDTSLRAYNLDGTLLFTTVLRSTPSSPVGRTALALSASGLLVLTTDGGVFGLRGLAGIADSPWPKHRRDNFGTGHR